jgi:hypothetical protein
LIMRYARRLNIQTIKMCAQTVRSTVLRVQM